MTVQPATSLSSRRFWLLWLPTFLGFPIGGLITGLGVGTAQAYFLRKFVPVWLWTLMVGILWALAWPITKLVIAESTENDYAVFGASGALFLTLLSGFVLSRAARPVPEVR